MRVVVTRAWIRYSEPNSNQAGEAEEDVSREKEGSDKSTLRFPRRISVPD